jgi:hypothetical protein
VDRVNKMPRKNDLERRARKMMFPRRERLPNHFRE